VEVIALTSSVVMAGESLDRRSPVGEPLPPGTPKAGRLATRLSLATAALMAGASTAGLAADALYREPAGLREMFRGYDLVTLAVAVPALLLGVVLSRRGSPRGRLLWLGTLFFAVYNYAIYVFGSAFNDLFLLHVAILTAAAAALTLGLRATDVDALAGRFGRRTPARPVAGVLAFLAVALGGMWVFYSLRFAVTGDPPAESALVVPQAITHLGYALDLSVLIPAYTIAAALLWRRAAWGFVLAPVLLLGGALQQLAYMTALIFQARADVPGATAFDPAEPIVVAAYAVGAWLLLRRLPANREEPPR
jgi:hypothetical protein